MNKYRNYSEEWLFNSDSYGKHVSAMTGEKLHSKSDIAAELAWRDDQLAKANERVKELEQSKHKESLETISDYILEFMQANGIENFSTNRLSTNEGRQIELTIRYVDGETPADQLERATQRVAELEQENRENLSIIESIASGLSEKPISLCKGVMQGRSSFLEKFAIENQIKALVWFDENNLMEDETTELLLERIEQLRKEQGE